MAGEISNGPSPKLVAAAAKAKGSVAPKLHNPVREFSITLHEATKHAIRAAADLADVHWYAAFMPLGDQLARIAAARKSLAEASAFLNAYEYEVKAGQP